MLVPHSETGRRWLAGAVLLVAGLATYANALRAPLIYDDVPAIEDNPFIQRLWPPSVFFSAPENSPVAGRPVLSLTLAVNHALGGPAAEGYHLFNLVVHVLCALLLFAIVRRTLERPGIPAHLREAAFGLALASALLWMLHPLQTEVVAYITQRSESLMGLFYLSTLYGVIRAHESDRPALWYAGAVAACALGMATKEAMVTAPLVVLLYDATFLSGSAAAALRARSGLYAGLAASWGVLVALMWDGPRAASIGFSHGIGALDYALNQAGVLVHYLRLAFWPHPLVLDYGRPGTVTVGEALLPGALVLVLLAATLALVVRRPGVGFLGAWFFLILAPTSSFVPIITEVGAERRMYLPLAALVIGVVLVGFEVVRRVAGGPERSLRLGVVLTSVLALALGIVSVRRNHDYRSAVTIWQTAVAARPDNPRAIANLGEALHGEDRLDEAIVLYRRAIAMDPERAIVHYDLANALRSQGDREGAIRHYREAVRIDPDYAPAHNNLANELQLLGRLEPAIEHYRRALEIEPDNALAHYNLGEALRQQGQPEAAVAQYRTAAELAPDVRPLALASTALVLVTHADPSARNARRAVQLAEEAVRATDASNPSLLLILAMSYAGEGRIEEATRTAGRALARAEAVGQQGLARTIRAQLEAFRAQSTPGS